MRKINRRTVLAGAGAVPALPAMQTACPGPMVVDVGDTGAPAQAALDGNKADAISFGRPYRFNPNLVERQRRGIALVPDDMKSWHTQGVEGYRGRVAAE